MKKQFQRAVLAALIAMPIVAAENGLCMGCSMRIRPQLYNEVLGQKVIHPCPTCGRILVVVPKETAAASEG